MNRWVCGGVLVLLAGSPIAAQVADVISGVWAPPLRPNPFGGGLIPIAAQMKGIQAQSAPPGAPILPGNPGAGQRPIRPNVPAGPPKVDRHGDPLPAGAVARYGTIRLRHGTEPHGLGFSPDGKVLGSLSNTNDGIRLWDPATGKELHRFNGTAQYAAFARDGSIVIIDETRCRHWIPGTNTIRDLPEKTLPENAQALAVNPDIRSFAVSSPGKITLIDLQTGKPLRELKLQGEQAAGRIVYSPDGRWLAASIQQLGIALWDLRTFKRVRTYRTGFESPEFAFSPDNSRLAISAEHLLVYTTDAEEVPDGYKAPEGEFLNPRFSADGKWIFAVSSSGDLRQVDAATGEAKEAVATPDPNVHTPIAISPEGAFVAAIDNSGGIKIWNPKTGKGPDAERLPVLNAPGFSADGKTIWALAVDGRLHSFDAVTGKPGKAAELPVDENTGVSWCPSARRATTLIAGDDFELQVFDVDTSKLIGKISVPNAAGVPIPSFCLSDRNRVALFLQGSVIVSTVSTGKTIRTITFGKPEDSPPSRGSISPDGRLLALASSPLSIWEVTSGKKRFDFNALPNALGAIFSPDGRLVAGWDGAGAVVVFDLRFGTLVRRMQMDSAGNEQLAIAFSPDSKRLAIGADDGVISVWEVATGDPLVSFDRHDGMVTGVAWSPDGTRLVSTAQDGTALVWEVPVKAADKNIETPVAGYDEAFRLLGSLDAASAQRGMDLLYRNPAEAMKQCADRIAVPTAAPAGRIAKLIADFEDEEFAVRQAAVKELETIGGEASSHLRSAIEKSSSAEVRKLAGEVLTRIEAGALKADDLRALRVIEVLENIASPESRALLTKWASGPAGHRLTTEATAALTRMKKGN